MLRLLSLVILALLSLSSGLAIAGPITVADVDCAGANKRNQVCLLTFHRGQPEDFVILEIISPPLDACGVGNEPPHIVEGNRIEVPGTCNYSGQARVEILKSAPLDKLLLAALNRDHRLGCDPSRDLKGVGMSITCPNGVFGIPRTAVSIPAIEVQIQRIDNQTTRSQVSIDPRGGRLTSVSWTNCGSVQSVQEYTYTVSFQTVTDIEFTQSVRTSSTWSGSFKMGGSADYFGLTGGVSVTQDETDTTRTRYSSSQSTTDQKRFPVTAPPLTRVRYEYGVIGGKTAIDFSGVALVTGTFQYAIADRYLSAPSPIEGVLSEEERTFDVAGVLTNLAYNRVVAKNSEEKMTAEECANLPKELTFFGEGP